jgi:hypothetical protein
MPWYGSHHLRFRKELTYNSTAVGEKIVDGLFSQILDAPVENPRRSDRGAGAKWFLFTVASSRQVEGTSRH